MINVFLVIAVDGQDCRLALNSAIADFEDGLIIVCAKKSCIDYIVTRDADFLKYQNYSTSMITPEQFLESIK